MYLLAIWCEPQTHPLLIKFLRLPGEQAIDLSGDIVTQDMFWMLVQTCAGNTDQIEALVVDRKVNQWVRATAVNALTLFTQQGGQSQDALEQQFRRILQALREPDPKDETRGCVDVKRLRTSPFATPQVGSKTPERRSAKRASSASFHPSDQAPRSAWSMRRNVAL